VKLTAMGACKSMNRAQEQKHLAQANGHIAELKVQIVRQRAIVKYALDTGQCSEMAESLLHALEESLGAFEKHRELIFDRLKCQIQTPPDPPDGGYPSTGRGLP
jgi:hypothetical protein